MKKQKSKDEFVTALIISSFSALTVFLFTPLHIYLTNLENYYFHTNILVLFLACLIISLLFICANTFILMKLKASFYKNSIVMLFLISLLFWFYCNILVWDYGLFTGTPFDWDNFTHRGIVDLIIYTIFFLLLFFKKKFIYRISKPISIMLILVQLVSLVFISTKKIQEDQNLTFFHRLDYDKKNIFSKDKNIIILVIDSFQTDLFQEIINKDKSFTKMLDGFTYFRNPSEALWLDRAKKTRNHHCIQTSPMDLVDAREFLHSESSVSNTPCGRCESHTTTGSAKS